MRCVRISSNRCPTSAANVRGQTDSEHVFHTIPSFLHDGGHQRQDVDNAAAHALRATVALLDRLCAEGRSIGDAQPDTHQRSLYGLRRGSPMYYAQRENPDGALPQGCAIFLVSDGPAVPVGYQSLRKGTCASSAAI